jgi:hypothetical protein
MALGSNRARQNTLEFITVATILDAVCRTFAVSLSDKRIGEEQDFTALLDVEPFLICTDSVALFAISLISNTCEPEIQSSVLDEICHRLFKGKAENYFLQTEEPVESDEDKKENESGQAEPARDNYQPKPKRMKMVTDDTIMCRPLRYPKTHRGEDAMQRFVSFLGTRLHSKYREKDLTLLVRSLLTETVTVSTKDPETGQKITREMPVLKLVSLTPEETVDHYIREVKMSPADAAKEASERRVDKLYMPTCIKQSKRTRVGRPVDAIWDVFSHKFTQEGSYAIGQSDPAFPQQLLHIQLERRPRVEVARTNLDFCPTLQQRELEFSLSMPIDATDWKMPAPRNPIDQEWIECKEPPLEEAARLRCEKMGLRHEAALSLVMALGNQAMAVSDVIREVNHPEYVVEPSYSRRRHREFTLETLEQEEKLHPKRPESSDAKMHEDDQDHKHSESKEPKDPPVSESEDELASHDPSVVPPPVSESEAALAESAMQEVDTSNKHTLENTEDSERDRKKQRISTDSPFF